MPKQWSINYSFWTYERVRIRYYRTWIWKNMSSKYVEINKSYRPISKPFTRQENIGS